MPFFLLIVCVVQTVKSPRGSLEKMRNQTDYCLPKGPFVGFIRQSLKTIYCVSDIQKSKKMRPRVGQWPGLFGETVVRTVFNPDFGGQCLIQTLVVEEQSLSCVMCYVLFVMCHMSYGTCHL